MRSQLCSRRLQQRRRRSPRPACCARTSGSRSAASRSREAAGGRSPCRLGRPMNGFCDSSKPSMHADRAAPCTWPVIGSPSRVRRRRSASSRSRQSPGRLSRCSSEKVIGRPRRSAQPRAAWRTRPPGRRSRRSPASSPRRPRRIAAAIATSSSSAAPQVGIVPAVERLVVDGARGREAERAGAGCPRPPARPSRAMSASRRRLAVGAALAHDVDAQRARAAPGPRRRRRSGARRAHRGIAESSPSSTAGPRSARPRGCPRRLPSA